MGFDICKNRRNKQPSSGADRSRFQWRLRQPRNPLDVLLPSLHTNMGLGDHGPR